MTSDLYLFAASWWSDPSNLVAAAKAAIGLGFVIFVHELGHFLVAKACGVKCEKFYVGFDVPISIGPIKLPSALWRKQWGETEYGIGIIPLGGYVKMLGQDDNPANAAKEAERIRQEEVEGVGEGLDPRSYPAKTVPQRMAIISAGVIMNIIFAVLFAMAAYKMGVKYTPCTIGATMPGDPAWLANLRPGDKMIQLGRDGRRSEQLRFRHDLRYKVIKTGEGNDCDFLLRRTNGEEEWVTIRPNTPYGKQTGGLPTIGVTSASSNRIAKPLVELDTPAQKTDLKADERIVNIEIGGTTHQIDSGLDIDRLLLQHPSDLATLTVQTPVDKNQAGSTRTVSLASRPIRGFGLQTKLGKIVAVQTDSPAAAVGISAGDQILKIDGEPITNPLSIDQQLTGRAGESVTLTIRRAGAKADEDVQVTVRAPEGDGLSPRPDGPISIETLGIALQVTNVVAAVETGSPAELAGIQPGDVLKSAEFVAPEESTKSANFLKQFRLNKPVRLGADEAAWPWIWRSVQSVPSDVAVKVAYLRGKQERSVEMKPVESATFFNPDRGLSLMQLSETRTASTLYEAFQLGIRETKEGVMQVFFTLRNIGHLYKNLGGPGTIAMAATSEASEGWPRLLIFLTLLSANLAVLNFLPIPVLDGGHMMFLIYEGLVGKPVNERIAFGLTMLGLSLILCLMVFVIGLDVYRLGFSG
jgi:regulator of sigma E protease